MSVQNFAFNLPAYKRAEIVKTKLNSEGSFKKYK
jgi:hypothetical protein